MFHGQFSLCLRGGLEGHKWSAAIELKLPSVDTMDLQKSKIYSLEKMGEGGCEKSIIDLKVFTDKNRITRGLLFPLQN